MDTLRAFLAIDVPLRLRPGLVLLQQWLRTEAPELEARFTRDDQLHVTLKFLGEEEPARWFTLARRLAPELAAEAPLVLELSGLSAFPNPHQANIVFASVLDPQARLARLVGRLELRAAELGVAREDRAFVPHVTLARLRHPQDLARVLPRAPQLAPREFRAEEVVLYRSEARLGGPEYGRLSGFPLDGSVDDAQATR